MAYNHIGEEEGLHYLLLALNQEPDNPILLTNSKYLYEMDDFLMRKSMQESIADSR